MEQREIILRQKLGKHGYKLKGANELQIFTPLFEIRVNTSLLCPIVTILWNEQYLHN